MRRNVSIAASVALAAGLLAGVTAAPASASTSDLVARDGTLTIRPPGTPSGSSQPSQRLESAVVRQDVDNWRVSAIVVLQAAPGPDARLNIGFGTGSPESCVIDTIFSTSTASDLSAGFTRSDRTITLDTDSTRAFTEDWTCAGVATGSAADGTYDQLTGALSDVYGQPELSIDAVQLLDEPVRRLSLVRGVWTTLEVTVSNAARFTAPEVQVGGGGAGLQVKPATYEVINRNGGQGTVRIPVRLTGKKKQTTLRLSASSRDTTTTRDVAVKQVAAAKRPVDGRYRVTVRGSKAQVGFRIKKGAVTGFKGTGFRMRCQPPGDYATYRTVGLRFPKKVKVSKAGLVDATHRWQKGNASYHADLRMRVTGSKVTQGSFTYVTGWCVVDADFAAKRVGR
ncbi:hypothetical protein [Nocardioides hwasunensis]|uniref:Uncharacterized protein n=1 Tax=Nocardioides hwasunensis TaxID=397258 RepID=A0ABR8MG10_9ACTN|nr:hypothetical protein [Nocardioides hwasunensis]MBD3915013.1 hypothetical protein [Nocardioides hwasunensis]